MARTITIVAHGHNHFDVFEGETYSDHLTWDEMLGQVAELTHSAINRARYPMRTPEERLDEIVRHNERMAELAAQRASEEGTAF